jgi:hypothetical protein
VDRKNPLGFFTLAARVVIVLGILLGGGGTWAYIAWAYADLPPGRYPVFLFAAPVILVAGVLVGLGLLTLKALGIRMIIVTRAEIETLNSGEQLAQLILEKVNRLHATGRCY